VNILREGTDGGRDAKAVIITALFMTSTLLHLPARIPALAPIRFDALVGLLAILVAWKTFADKHYVPSESERSCTNRLYFLFAYIIFTLPFVKWPGTTLRTGLEDFFKAVVFYFLVVWSVWNTRQLGLILAVFGLCQTIRILEPLYLHLTEGYWGGITHMGNWEFMNRLSGAPSDIVNPNGLAFLVIFTLPLIYYFTLRQRPLVRLFCWAVMGAMIYTLVLTGSRSGFLVLAMLVTAWILTSRRKALAIGVVAVATVVALSSMSELQRYRYLSIFRSDVPGAGTADGRISGVWADFQAALQRPVFGHGLGTSQEVNTHFRGNYQKSHNLYTEVAQELGFVGLAIYLSFIFAAVKAAWRARSSVTSSGSAPPALSVASDALPVQCGVLLVFGLATYGLSQYEWYFLTGMCVVTARLTASMPPVPDTAGQSISAAVSPTKTHPHFRKRIR
jgi:O-antigen ligase